MAVLEKIRVKFGVLITVLIAVALLSFIIDPNTLASVSQSMSSKYDVGKINGKSVSYTDFQQDIEKFTTISEILSGSSVHSEEQQKAIRDAAWQSLVDKYLFLDHAKDAGLIVGDDEIVDLTVGDNISPLIAQSPIFAGPDGSFSKEAVLEFINNIDMDETGRVKLFWDYLQNTVLTQQYYLKYGSLFTESNLANPLMLAKQIEENNSTSDAEFVMVPYGYSLDSTITVSNKEIKEYYNAHKKFYKQEASRDIEYVVYQAVPSAKDIEATHNDMLKAYDEFSKTDNMKSFLLQNSDRQLSDYYYGAGELNTISSEINDFVVANKPGAISNIFEGENVFYAVKVLDSKQLPKQVYVHAFPYANQASADSLINVINKGQDFATAANLNAISQNYIYEGWMNQSNMLDASVLTAPLNKAYKFDYSDVSYIIKVTERQEVATRKSVAILERNIIPSQETRNIYYAKANETATRTAGKAANFRAAADSVGGYVQTLNNLIEGADKIGSVDNAKEVTRWVYEAKKGKVSEVITVNNDCFFVVNLKNINKEGYTPVDQLASNIKQVLYQEKLSAKKSAEISDKIAGLESMEAVAESLGAEVSKKDGIAFASLNAQGLDPKFIGAVSAAELNKISCVAGTYGVYVFNVTNRETGAFFTEDDAKARSSQMAQYSAQMLMPVMMEEGEVKDVRNKFF